MWLITTSQLFVENEMACVNFLFVQFCAEFLN